MASFRDQLRALHAHPGVHAVVAAGRDGLLIDHAGGGTADDAAAAEHLAALAPGLVAAAQSLAQVSLDGAGAAGDGGAGGVRSVVVESGARLVVALPVTPDVTVLAAIDPGHADAASAVGRVRGERGALAGAV